MAEKETIVTVPTATPRNEIAARDTDPVSGAVWVWTPDGMRMDVEPWPVPPVKADEKFADVKSWAAYVKTYRNPETAATLLTWNEKGLRAVLDYHSNGSEEAGRCQWIATMPFQAAPEWAAWQKITIPAGLTQRQAVDALEERESEITDPATATLLTMLRNLRPYVNSKAEIALKPNGGTRMTYKDSGVRSGPNEVELPGTLEVSIPVLRGAADDEGKPLLAALTVRLRATSDKEDTVTLRFTVVHAEAALEDAMLSLVAAAETALGTGYSLLRTV